MVRHQDVQALCHLSNLGLKSISSKVRGFQYFVEFVLGGVSRRWARRGSEMGDGVGLVAPACCLTLLRVIVYVDD